MSVSPLRSSQPKKIEEEDAAVRRQQGPEPCPAHLRRQGQQGKGDQHEQQEFQQVDGVGLRYEQVDGVGDDEGVQGEHQGEQADVQKAGLESKGVLPLGSHRVQRLQAADEQEQAEAEDGGGDCQDGQFVRHHVIDQSPLGADQGHGDLIGNAPAQEGRGLDPQCAGFLRQREQGEHLTYGPVLSRRPAQTASQLRSIPE